MIFMKLLWEGFVTVRIFHVVLVLVLFCFSFNIKSWMLMLFNEFCSCLSLKSEAVSHIIAVHWKGNFHMSSVTFWVQEILVSVSKPSPNPSNYNWQQVAAERNFERAIFTAWKGRYLSREMVCFQTQYWILLPLQIQLRLLAVLKVQFPT